MAKPVEFAYCPDRPWEGNFWPFGPFEAELIEAEGAWLGIVRRDGEIVLKRSEVSRVDVKLLLERELDLILTTEGKSLKRAINQAVFGLGKLHRALKVKGSVEFECLPFCKGQALADGTWTITIGGKESSGRQSTGKLAAIEMLTILKSELDNRYVVNVLAQSKLKEMRVAL